MCGLTGNGNLNLDTRLNGNRGDLLNNLRGGVEINQTLVDTHLEAVKGGGTVTTGGLAGGDAQNLGGHANGALDLELLLLSTVDQVGADWEVFGGKERERERKL